MSLADALESHRNVHKGPRCQMCMLVKGLPESDRVALVKALADPVYSTASIARALRSEGHDIGRHSVDRHRKQECKG